MLTVVSSVGNWLIQFLVNHPVRQYFLWLGSALILALVAGLLVGMHGPFGVASSGLVLAVFAQIAEMYEQTIPAANDEDIKRTKVFAGAMKLFGIILLGIGAMVGLSAS